MIPGFQAVVEERIKKAQQEGAFDNLEGSGKPLNFEDLNIPEPYRIAYKILKNAGFLPPELELKKDIRNTRELLNACCPDSAQRPEIQKKLNYLLTKLNTLRGGQSLSFTALEAYRENLVKKIS